MTKKNPSNPFSRDEVETQRDMPTPVQKAKVVSVEDHPDESGFHTVRIRVYGEPDSQYFRAPVVAPHKGDVTVPERGDDVLVMFGPNDKPWVIGFWYALDRAQDDLDTIDVPEYDEGDRIIGNGSGSYIAIRDDGSIEIRTTERQPVNLDHQSASIFMSSDYNVAGDDVYDTLPFDSPDDDPEDLHDGTDSLVIRDDGQHDIDISIEVASAGQNNLYQLAVFKNGSEWKRASKQSSVNEPLSLSVSTQKKLDEGDVLDARLRQDSGSTKTVSSDTATTEFNISRRGT